MRKIDFIIFGVIYMMVIGIVASIFNPGMYLFGESDYIAPPVADPPRERSGIIDKIAGVLTGIATVIVSIVTFFWAGFSMNIPGVPWMVKIVMLSPMWAGWGYVIVSTLWKGGE